MQAPKIGMAIGVLLLAIARSAAPAIAEVGDAVRSTAARQLAVPAEQVSVVSVEPAIWSDGCLGLGPPGRLCTEVLVKGWQVRVRHQLREWVYRTNASGSVVYWDQAASPLLGWVAPPAVRMSVSDRPVPLKKSALLRAIYAAEAGAPRTVILYRNGRLVETGTAGETLLRTVPKDDVKALRLQLDNRHFGQFDGFQYGTGVVLSDRLTTVQYQPQGSLPDDLAAIVEAWSKLLGTVP